MLPFHLVPLQFFYARLMASRVPASDHGHDKKQNKTLSFHSDSDHLLYPSLSLSMRCSYDILLGLSRCSLLTDDYTAYLILASFVCFPTGV